MSSRDDHQVATIQGAIHLASLRFQEPLTRSDLARACGLPSNTLNRRFNHIYGMSPVRWLWRFRTMLAAELIAAAPDLSLTDVAVYCGFNSLSHFSRRFSEVFRQSPKTFREHFQWASNRQRPKIESYEAVIERNPKLVAQALAKLNGRATARPPQMPSGFKPAIDQDTGIA